MKIFQIPRLVQAKSSRLAYSCIWRKYVGWLKVGWHACTRQLKELPSFVQTILQNSKRQQVQISSKVAVIKLSIKSPFIFL